MNYCNCARITFLTLWKCLWGSENKRHSTLRQMIAQKHAIHHPISPSPPQNIAPTRWLGPTQQGVGLGGAHCNWVGKAAHHQFKFSPVTSVQVQVRAGALPIVLSESREMTSVQHSESVVVRLSDFDQLPTWSQMFWNKPNRGLLQVQNIRYNFFIIRKCTITVATVFALPLSATLDTARSNRMAGMQLDPLMIIWLQRLIVCKFPAC